MSVTTLSAIENGDRRADVDDLVAIAAALDISPPPRCLPLPTPTRLRVQASSPACALEAGQLWDWLTATAPLDAPLLAEERDEVAAEVWRREQVPAVVVPNKDDGSWLAASPFTAPATSAPTHTKGGTRWRFQIRVPVNSGSAGAGHQAGDQERIPLTEKEATRAKDKAVSRSRTRPAGSAPRSRP